MCPDSKRYRPALIRPVYILAAYVINDMLFVLKIKHSWKLTFILS